MTILGDLGEQPQEDMSVYYQPPPEPENDVQITGGLPINLDSLRDGPPGTKPFYPYSTLIRYAIKGSPNQRLLLEDIYYAIESRFPYFRSAPNGWKNSVRHNLSLNPCFEKVPRPLTDRGKGSYWTVNENVDPRTGVHRVRKKYNKKGGKGRSSEEVQEMENHATDSYEDPHAQYVSPEGDASQQSQSSFPQTYPPPPFDPSFMFGIPPPVPGPMPILPDENMELDEHGNVNWYHAWVKEIGHLQAVTTEQEKAGADQEWYRMMLIRIRTALMPPPMLTELPPHMVPHPPTDGQ
ncbi:uncharacterized protein BT62DRAFT_929379 [Guyanagaster necrorhizus]|uniref:Fork-head domain-containing protein n=1 Tax=Guyanagaster necrorhizus TaxID=856835 RepID=A0A9P7VZ43_9AGAR|nr:uncharacterized protein BT62DRAFT_929379 [Guyanagaster necrorhizus MCA 3950]KAG7449410.1 hypothetical protein BT62DRAFT_929379 [Guyanagaster necrorhizus MCA 3950]